MRFFKPPKNVPKMTFLAFPTHDLVFILNLFFKKTFPSVKRFRVPNIKKERNDIKNVSCSLGWLQGGFRVASGWLCNHRVIISTHFFSSITWNVPELRYLYRTN